MNNYPRELREARLHDARQTAATVLLILGQPERTVMSLMGVPASRGDFVTA
jgi:hypothetical protein